jgi:hypothetical protein
MFYRIVLEIFYVDIEYQKDCLYDALTIDGFDNNTVLCGNIHTDLPLDEIMVCDIKGMLIVSFPQNC